MTTTTAPNMPAVAQALTAATSDYSDENVAALVQAVDYNAGTLAKLAIGPSNTPHSSVVLLGTAAMLSDSKAVDAKNIA